jgi:hypothetical protein
LLAAGGDPVIDFLDIELALMALAAILYTYCIRRSRNRR